MKTNNCALMVLANRLLHVYLEKLHQVISARCPATGDAISRLEADTKLGILRNCVVVPHPDGAKELIELLVESTENVCMLSVLVQMSRRSTEHVSAVIRSSLMPQRIARILQLVPQIMNYLNMVISKTTEEREAEKPGVSKRSILRLSLHGTEFADPSTPESKKRKTADAQEEA